MASLRTKIVLQFIVNNLTIVSNFVLSIFLARILTPTDIGIFSMSAILIAIAHVFRDFGVAAYIKRDKELTHKTIRSAMGLLISTSWSVSILLYVSSSHWATFLNEPRVADVVQILAIGFIFIPFGAIPSAILTRRLEVRKTSTVALVSNISHFVFCLGFAYTGFGHLTMALANLVDIIVCWIGYRWVLGERLPMWPSISGWGKIAQFGLGNIFPTLLQKVDSAFPDIFLGRLSTPAAVGLFSRANSTVNMLGEAINPTINYFALPYLAQLHHKNGRIDQEYIKSTSLLNSIVLPTLVVVATFATEIISLLFGNQWLISAEAIPWLCVSFGFSSLFTLTTPAVTSIGKPYAAIGPLLLALVFKAFFAFILFDGSLANFAMSLAVSQIAITPLYLLINKVYLRIGVGIWFYDTLRLLALSVIVGITCLLVKRTMPADSMHFLMLTASGVSTFIVSILTFWLLRLPIIHELTAIPFFRRFLPKFMLT